VEEFGFVDRFLFETILFQVYVLVTSVSEQLAKFPYMNNDNEREFEELDKPERFIYPCVDKFSVQLISPTAWEMVPNAK